MEQFTAVPTNKEVHEKVQSDAKLNGSTESNGTEQLPLPQATAPQEWSPMQRMEREALKLQHERRQTFPDLSLDDILLVQSEVTVASHSSSTTHGQAHTTLGTLRERLALSLMEREKLEETTLRQSLEIENMKRSMTLPNMNHSNDKASATRAAQKPEQDQRPAAWERERWVLETRLHTLEEENAHLVEELSAEQRSHRASAAEADDLRKQVESLRESLHSASQGLVGRQLPVLEEESTEADPSGDDSDANDRLEQVEQSTQTDAVAPHEHEREVDVVNAHLDALSTSQLRQRALELSEALRLSQEQLRFTEHQLTESQRDLQSAETSLADVSKKMQGTVTALIEQNRELEMSLTQPEREQYQRQIAGLQEAVAKLETRVRTAEIQQQRAVEELAEANVHISRLAQSNSQLREDLTARNSENTRLEADLTDAVGRARESTLETERLREELERQATGHSATSQELSQLRLRLESGGLQRSQREGELERSLAERDGALTLALQELDAARRDKSRLGSSLAGLRLHIQQHELETAQMIGILQAKLKVFYAKERARDEREHLDRSGVDDGDMSFESPASAHTLLRRARSRPATEPRLRQETSAARSADSGTHSFTSQSARRVMGPNSPINGAASDVSRQLFTEEDVRELIQDLEQEQLIQEDLERSREEVEQGMQH